MPTKKHEKVVDRRAPEDILRMPTATPVSPHICPVPDCSAWLSPPLTKVQQGRMQAYCLLEVNPWTLLTQMTSNPCICNTILLCIRIFYIKSFVVKSCISPFPPCPLIALDTASHDPPPSASKSHLPANIVSFPNEALAGPKATPSDSNSLKAPHFNCFATFQLGDLWGEKDKEIEGDPGDAESKIVERGQVQRHLRTVGKSRKDIDSVST